MEDKIFDLMTKIYSELQEVKTEMRSEFNNVKGDIQDIKTEICSMNQSMVRMEDKYDKKIEALFDGYQQNTETSNQLKNDVQNLTRIIENHEIKLKVVK